MNKKYLAAAVVCLVLAVVCVAFAVNSNKEPSFNPDDYSQTDTSDAIETPDAADTSAATDESTATDTEKETEKVPFDTDPAASTDTDAPETPAETESETIPEAVESITEVITEAVTEAATEAATTPATEAPTMPLATEAPATEPATEAPATETETEAQPETPSYKSPIDFDKLQSTNPDVYAWVKIDGTNVNFPICQHPSDDGYYLKVGYDGRQAKEGAIYTEATYNTKTFDDRVTVVYGHRMNNGSMFGELQPTFSEKENFDSIRTVVIYTPEKELYYNIVAAVPTNNYHILANYNFESSFWFYNYFDNLWATRAVGANFLDGYTPSYDGDKFLILSTCMWGDQSKRYLIVATLQG